MDEASVELTRRWLAKAAADLANANIVAKTPSGPLGTAIYHCQQAAEKAVKAYLVFRDEPFAKTHEIEPLVRKAAHFEPRFLEFATSASWLTPFAWQFRYPSELATEEARRCEAADSDRLCAAHLRFRFEHPSEGNSPLISEPRPARLTHSGSS